MKLEIKKKQVNNEHYFEAVFLHEINNKSYGSKMTHAVVLGGCQNISTSKASIFMKLWNSNLGKVSKMMLPAQWTKKLCAIEVPHGSILTHLVVLVLKQ